jgi:hypothetical protein
VVVAVLAVRVMQVTVDDVVRVVAVSDGVVAAGRTVNVVLRVARAGVRRRAVGRVLTAHREGMFVDVIAVDVVEVAVVEEILVTIVLDLLVAAVGAVLVVVTFVRLVIRHRVLLRDGWRERQSSCLCS